MAPACFSLATMVASSFRIYPFMARLGGLSRRDLSPERAPIKPLQAILPALRANGVPIVWLNWGNRPDRMNLRPTTLYVFNPDGKGIGIGGPLPGNGAHLL